jgi:hypothetical protein
MDVFLRAEAHFAPALTGQTDVAVTVVDTVLNRSHFTQCRVTARVQTNAGARVVGRVTTVVSSGTNVQFQVTLDLQAGTQIVDHVPPETRVGVVHLVPAFLAVVGNFESEVELAAEADVNSHRRGGNRERTSCGQYYETLIHAISFVCLSKDRRISTPTPLRR